MSLKFARLSSWSARLILPVIFGTTLSNNLLFLSSASPLNCSIGSSATGSMRPWFNCKSSYNTCCASSCCSKGLSLPLLLSISARILRFLSPLKRVSRLLSESRSTFFAASEYSRRDSPFPVCLAVRRSSRSLSFPVNSISVLSTASSGVSNILPPNSPSLSKSLDSIASCLAILLSKSFISGCIVSWVLFNPLSLAASAPMSCSPKGRNPCVP